MTEVNYSEIPFNTVTRENRSEVLRGTPISLRVFASALEKLNYGSMSLVTPHLKGYRIDAPEDHHINGIIHIKNYAMVRRTLLGGGIGLYESFADDDDTLDVLMRMRPAVVSLHFGLPSQDKIDALKAAGCAVIATATSLKEAELIEAAGLDAIVAQGYEAGGHRGIFDPSGADSGLGTLPLTQILAANTSLPVIAAGGIMNGQGIAAALRLGAESAQLGTAFVASPESNANTAYRAALMGDGAHHTVMLDAISGRPARCLSNKITDWAARQEKIDPPAYPIAYDAGKALHSAGKAEGEFGYGAQWAGQGAPLARALPAAELVETLIKELADADRRVL